VTLIMPTPVKDKKSGIYYIRVRIPADLVSTIGRHEISKSLRTREPSEAKERFSAEYAALQQRWAALRAKPEPIPLKQIVSLAGRVYWKLMAALENEPGEAEIWGHVKRLNGQASESDTARAKWYGPVVDEVLLGEGISVDADSRIRLLTEVQRAYEQATEQQYKRAQGDFSPDPDVARFPEWGPDKKPISYSSRPTISEAFNRWKKDHISNGKSSRSADDFSQKLAALKDYLGHEDIERITPKEVSDWCDYLRHEKGLLPKTVSGKYLGAARAVFRHAKSKFLIERDPTEGVSFKIPDKIQSRPLGYTDDEAQRILHSALEVFEKGSKAAHHNKLACHWVPWICAYTGARVGEITQLRTRDLTFEHGIPLITITPEAGTVKARRYRIVPLHPHLQEIGLTRFIQSATEGYLFHAGGDTNKEILRRSGNARDKIAEWVRNSVGIIDKRIQPNHAWRHRFKTAGRNADIAVDYLDAIQGHSSRNSGEKYGEYAVETLYREICKLPRINVC
jgi:integrase